MATLQREQRMRREAMCPDLPHVTYPGVYMTKPKRSPPKYEFIGGCWDKPNIWSKADRKRYDKESALRKKESWNIIKRRMAPFALEKGSPATDNYYQRPEVVARLKLTRK